MLTVNVATGEWRRIPWPHPTVANGLLAALLLDAWKRTGPTPVVLAGGGLSGYSVIAGATAVVCGRSPQSDGLGEARVEGRLAAALRAAGTTAVLLHGRSAHPVVVSLAGREPAIVDARSWAGADAAVTTTALRTYFSPDCVVGAVGAAGEAGSAMASVVFDYGFPTATGGLGGALGRLGVKAVVLPPPTARAGGVDPLLATITADYAGRIDANPLARSQRDPPGFGVWTGPGLSGYLGALNFSRDAAPDTAPARGPVGPTTAAPSCPGCPQDCVKRYPTGDSHPECGRLHQLALPIWASQLGITNLDSGFAFNAECHRYGLEHLTMGAMLGVLAELQASEPPAADDGASRPPSLPMSFGDGRGGLALVRRWGEDPRTVPGGSGRLDDFAEAAGDADAPVMTVKGMPIPPIDPRGCQGLGLAMALNPSGPHYDVVEHDIDFDLDVAWPRHAARGRAYGVPASGLRMGTLDVTRVGSVILLWELWSALEALGVCLFASPPTRELDEQQVTALVSRATVVDVTFDEVLCRGRERLAAQRRLNYRWGVGESTESLPDRFFEKPVTSGRLTGAVVARGEFSSAAAAVREHFGWGDRVAGAAERDGLAELTHSVATLGVDR